MNRFASFQWLISSTAEAHIYRMSNVKAKKLWEIFSFFFSSDLYKVKEKITRSALGNWRLLQNAQSQINLTLDLSYTSQTKRLIIIKNLILPLPSFWCREDPLKSWGPINRLQYYLPWRAVGIKTLPSLGKTFMIFILNKDRLWLYWTNCSNAASLLDPTTSSVISLKFITLEGLNGTVCYGHLQQQRASPSPIILWLQMTDKVPWCLVYPSSPLRYIYS